MNQRIHQIGSVIQQELSLLFLRELELPPGTLVTITAVDVSPDHRHAKVWLSILPEGVTGSALEVIKKNAGHLQFFLNKRLTTKPLPRLNFALDTSERKAADIDELLDKIKDKPR